MVANTKHPTFVSTKRNKNTKFQAMTLQNQKELNKKVSDNYINDNCTKCVYLTGFIMKGGHCHWNNCAPIEIVEGRKNAIKCDFNKG